MRAAAIARRDRARRAHRRPSGGRVLQQAQRRGRQGGFRRARAKASPRARRRRSVKVGVGRRRRMIGLIEAEKRPRAAAAGRQRTPLSTAGPRRRSRTGGGSKGGSSRTEGEADRVAMSGPHDLPEIGREAGGAFETAMRGPGIPRRPGTGFAGSSDRAEARMRERRDGRDIGSRRPRCS